MTAVHHPTSPAEALSVLHDAARSGQSAVIVGGGTIVLPELGRVAIDPEHLVDLWRCGLDGIETVPQAGGSERLRLGAMVTYQQLLDDADAQRRIPLLRPLCAAVSGGRTIRSQGTLVGSLCAARPYSDAPAGMTALQGVVRIRHAGGVRELDVSSFLTGSEHTTLQPGELVEAVDLPLPDPAYTAVHRKIKSAEGSWAVVTLSAVHCGRSTRLAIGGVAGTPVVMTVPDDEPVEHAVAHLITVLGPDQVRDPFEDIRADNSYRRGVAADAAREVLTEIRSAGRRTDRTEEG